MLTIYTNVLTLSIYINVLSISMLFNFLNHICLLVLTETKMLTHIFMSGFIRKTKGSFFLSECKCTDGYV